MIVSTQSHLQLKHILHRMPQLASADYKILRESIYERLGVVLVADILGMANDEMTAAKKGRNDEFYTSYEDIEKEMNAYLEYNPDVFKDKVILLPCDDPEWSNFTRYFAQNAKKLGFKKLISTSYAPNLKSDKDEYQTPLFEFESPFFDASKTKANGKIFILTDEDVNNDGKIDIEDLQWAYLEGDGDFRSEEVRKLRDEADFIITNPPFSLFREFLAWIVEAKKGFAIIGNVNAITYKEAFPLIKENKMWLGATISSGDREFRVPDSYPLESAGWRIDDEGNKYIRVKGVRWFTNIEHGRRHEPLSLMNMADNIKFSKHKVVKENGYQKYDNYDAIEISFTDAIPSDHDGAMGVPITFLDKYNPDQFEILDCNDFRESHQPVKGTPLIKDKDGSVNGVNKYARIVIRHKKKAD